MSGRKQRFAVALLVVLLSIFICGCEDVCAADGIEGYYDPQYTMLALNMAIASVHRIIMTEDRIVLDQEYRNIINNLSIGNIEDDYDLKYLFDDLMVIIHEKTLRKDEAERFQHRYEVHEKRLMVKALSNMRPPYGGNGWSFLGSLVVTGASAYFSYSDARKELQEELDNTLWELEKNYLQNVNDLQRRLLNSSWSLLRQYKLPDEFRLVQRNLDDLTKALQTQDPALEFRMLQELETNFKAYPPFWFFYGQAALRNGNLEHAYQCFAEFDKVWRPVLRQDPYKLEIAKYRALDLARLGAPAAEIETQLGIVRANTLREDWNNNLFAGVMYFAIGKKEQGRKCLEVNIDFGNEREISGIVLQSMEKDDLNIEHLSTELQSIISGLMYLNGDGTNQNDKKAVEYFSKAAALGNREAQYLLSQLYREGRGVPQDYDQAAQWCRKAADAGDVRAQTNLGLMYEHGLGVKRDDIEAVNLFFKAATGGSAYAQYHMGTMFERGRGLPQNIEKAYMWYYMASLNGFSEAQKKVEELEANSFLKRITFAERLSKESINNAQEEAREKIDRFKLEKR